MDKHNSLLLTEIAVLLFFALLALPLARLARGFFHLSQHAGLLLAVGLALGLTWLFYWIANARNRAG